MEKKNDNGSVSHNNTSAADLLSKLNTNIEKNPSKGIKYSTAQPKKDDIPRRKISTAENDTDGGIDTAARSAAPRGQRVAQGVNAKTTVGNEQSTKRSGERIKPQKLYESEQKTTHQPREIDKYSSEITKIQDETFTDGHETSKETHTGSSYRVRVESRKKTGSLLPVPDGAEVAEKSIPHKASGGISKRPDTISDKEDEIPQIVADRYQGFGHRPKKTSRADLQKRIEDAEKYITDKQTQQDIVIIKEPISPIDEKPKRKKDDSARKQKTSKKIKSELAPVVAEKVSKADEMLEADKTADAVPDSDFDETDMNLMIAFGMEEELERRVGADKASELEQNIDKSSGDIEEKLIKTGEVSENNKEEFEFVALTQVRDIFKRYKSEYTGLLWRIITCSILLIISFFYENIEMLGGTLPSMIDPRSYPIVHVLIGLQLLTLAGALIYKPLISGFKTLVRFKPTPESAISVMVAISVVYHIVLCLLDVYSGVRLYNFPLILAVLLTLLYEFNNLKREIYAFNIAASKKDKFTVDKIDGEDAALERDAFYEYLSESPLMFRIGRVKFVDGFYRRMRAPASDKRALAVIIPVIVAASAAVFGVAMVLDGSLYTSMLLAYITLVIGMPFSIFITYSYPFYIASKEAFENESAIIGESSLEEYAKASVISFDDSDVFPPNGVKLKTVKVFGDNRIDRVINDVRSVFSVLGGPLSEVFEIATLDMKANEDKVEIIEIADDGIEAMLGDRRILVGKGDCLRRHEFEPVNSREDDELENGGEITVMYMVINNEVVAKMYIQYIIDPDFEFTLKQLYKSGMCVGIKTLDPNINDMMLSSRVKVSKYAVKVLKYHEPFEEPDHDGRSDSGVITKDSPKALLQTLALCDKVLHIVKTNNVVKVFSIIISMVIMTFLLILNLAPSVLSVYVALYQIFWIIPMVIISRLFI